MKSMKYYLPRQRYLCLMLTLLFCQMGFAKSERQTISLNGDWQIAEGSYAEMPNTFNATVPVPGLADMATPPFEGAGDLGKINKKSKIKSPPKDSRREAFWYRKTFELKGAVPDIVQLRIRKAKYTIKVFVNGVVVGESKMCFSPNTFDISKAVKGNGQPNTVTVRVGSSPAALKFNDSWGFDGEKLKYIPGIYDDVDLICSSAPFITEVQLVPNINDQTLRIIARIENGSKPAKIALSGWVSESVSGKSVEKEKSQSIKLGAYESHTYDFTIPIKEARLWSPNDPFLYQLKLSTGADTWTSRFGMRHFAFDPVTKKGKLNNKTYYLRGTNICIFRFFEDAARGNKPWDKEWARTVIRRCKEMNWNCMRVCIGPLPDFWYDLCDEEGFLVQDEYPLWCKGPKTPSNEDIIAEGSIWLKNHINHPSIFMWDIQNESRGIPTKEAVQALRKIDLSERPWDNGYEAPDLPTDPIETHPYFFMFYAGEKGREIDPEGILVPGFNHLKTPGNGPTQISKEGGDYDQHPIMINEYGWIWLDRKGDPTELTKHLYPKLFPAGSTPEQRLERWSYYLAAMTEYWRANRLCAGVLHFTVLSYSRPGGYTSDNFKNIETLEFDPYFKKYVGDSFSPVGVMIDFWKENLPINSKTIPIAVSVINDFDTDWEGTLKLILSNEEGSVSVQERSVKVLGLGNHREPFMLTLPPQAGTYKMVAELHQVNGKIIQSVRQFKLEK